MSCVYYQDQELHIENVSLATIASEYETPCYVYSQKAIEQNYRAFAQAFQHIPHRICFAVKANSNIAILRILANMGAGFDIVSIGELKRVIAAESHARKVIFSGVGKTAAEIKQALELGIFCFNVESEPELERIAGIAADLGKTADIILRLNPNIDAKTHSYISTGLKANKFGIELDDISRLLADIKKLASIHLIGIGSHIGSQITELEPFVMVVDYLLEIYETIKEEGFQPQFIDIGGGLGITYQNETPPSIEEYAEVIQQKISQHNVKLILEPGRAIVGNAGVLLTRVEYIKKSSDRNFAIVDAGMNDLLRPALYNAWQEILPVVENNGSLHRYDIAGPVCESADFLGKERELAIMPGELLAVNSAGAYGFSMSSNYNSRCRPAEVLVNGDQSYLIRRRETIEDAIALEQLVME